MNQREDENTPDRGGTERLESGRTKSLNDMRHS